MVSFFFYINVYNIHKSYWYNTYTMNTFQYCHIICKITRVYNKVHSFKNVSVVPMHIGFIIIVFEFIRLFLGSNSVP